VPADPAAIAVLTQSAGLGLFSLDVFAVVQVTELRNMTLIMTHLRLFEYIVSLHCLCVLNFVCIYCVAFTVLYIVWHSQQQQQQQLLLVFVIDGPPFGKNWDLFLTSTCDCSASDESPA